MDFKFNYDQYRNDIEQYLEGILNDYDVDDCVILDAMKYSLLGGGKRVRAVLVLAVCDMLCKNHKRSIPAAAAVEMLHCYSLIHDDLPCMDDDDMRRGKPSCHVAFGEAAALLTGDALLTMAFEMLSNVPNSEHSKMCTRTLSVNAGFLGMIRGQELDLKLTKHMQDEKLLNQIHQNKTSKLIQASVVMGAICGGANQKQIDALDEYAQDIGLVFQIVDDILDCTSTEQQLGKPINSDELNEKLTFVSIYGLEKSREKAEEITKKAVLNLRNNFNDDADFLCGFAESLLKRTN